MWEKKKEKKLKSSPEKNWSYWHKNCKPSIKIIPIICERNVHTYIHKCPLKPHQSGLLTWFLTSLYVVCVDFIHKWQDLQFKVDSKRQDFCENFHGNYIYSQSFCQKSIERKLSKEYFLYFGFMCGLGFKSWLYA